MLDNEPALGSTVYGVHRERTVVFRANQLLDAEKSAVAVKRVEVERIWYLLTKEGLEWWVGTGEGDVYLPEDLFATRAAAVAAAGGVVPG